MTWLIGIDVGGTFTDFYAVSTADGSVRLYKHPSTPANPSDAIVDGLEAMCREFAIVPSEVERIGHGTTVATNALIQRTGAKVALITTKGFRDLLEIGRQTRPHMYSLQDDHPEPLVPRELRFEIAERLLSDGSVHVALAEGDTSATVRRALASGADAVAVCFLFAYVNPVHERRVGTAISQRSGDLPVSLSSDVQPEFREYERFSTTVLNAYLQPMFREYLGQLSSKIGASYGRAALGIYQSSGGMMSVGTARRFPVRTALSGPAAGVVGAVHVARASERPNLITLDMGGTSADVALIRNYQTGVGHDRSVADFPIRLPMVDIHTVGAGGGSILWFDRDGLAKVGPQSAGADPGPACYGRGGTQPTVTDANLVLGRLGGGGLIGGRMTLDDGLARKAFAPAAKRLGYSVEKTALGLLGIVTANMVRAIRTVSVERGHDPRDYVLMAFGGAGPLHAGDVARALGIREVLVPAHPGILCAQGLVVSDLKEDFVHSRRLPLDAASLKQLRGVVKALNGEVAAWFEREGVSRSGRAVEAVLDLRYVGQNFELPVHLARTTGARAPGLPPLGRLHELFFEAHRQHYGFHNPDDPVEVVNVRLTARGTLSVATAAPARRKRARLQPIAHRPVHFTAARAVRTPVYDRAALAPGHGIVGPAIIQQLDSTTVVHPGDTLHVDEAENFLIENAQ
ncbi:MAG: hydantoinase/oxoprolinase family protein [Hyphomicrobiales bacterium]